MRVTPVLFDPFISSFYRSGDAVGSLGDLDEIVIRYMALNCIPNGALAVISADNRLVYCKAFTNCAVHEQHKEEVFYADVHSLFRVASLSKAITAVATVAAAEDGEFGPDGVQAKAYEFTNLEAGFGFELGESDDSFVDNRLKNITLHHLLTHSAGWVENEAEVFPAFPKKVIPGSSTSKGADLIKEYIVSPGFAPQLRDIYYGSAVGIGGTPITQDIIEFFVNLLDLTWDPADPNDIHWSYCGHGYARLASIIENATGYSYESYVQCRVWDRIGAHDSRLAGSKLSERNVNEVKYYGQFFEDESNAITGVGYRPNILARYDDWPVESPEDVEDLDCGNQKGRNIPCALQPYASHNFSNGKGSGGWLCSIYDLALLMQDIFMYDTSTKTYNRDSKILSKTSLEAMLYKWIERDGNNNYQGYGWEEGRKYADSYSKGGSMAGTHSLAYAYGVSTNSAGRGVRFVYVFNRFDSDVFGEAWGRFDGELFPAIENTTNWGSTTDDLFGSL